MMCSGGSPRTATPAMPTTAPTAPSLAVSLTVPTPTATPTSPVVPPRPAMGSPATPPTPPGHRSPPGTAGPTPSSSERTATVTSSPNTTPAPGTAARAGPMTPTVRPPPPSTPPAASSSPRGLGTSATKATGDPTGHYSAADYEAAVFAEREYGVPLPAEMVLPPTTTPIEDTYNGWDEIGSMHQASTRPDIDDTYNGLDEINAMHEATTCDLYCRARQAGPAGNNVNELGGLAGDGPAVAPTRIPRADTSQGREDWCRATVPVGPCSFSVRPQPLNLDDAVWSR